MSGRVLVNGRLISLEAAARRLRNHPGHSPQKSHGGGSSDDDDVGDGGELDAAPMGRDPKGVPYSEHDVDVDGNPKFSQAYRDEYGPLERNYELGGKSGFAVAKGEKRGTHVADDSDGPMNRRVVQEFTPKQAQALGEGVFAVYSGERSSFSGAGVEVKPAGSNPTRDGVEVTWSSGTKTRFEGEGGDDEAFDLQEALSLSD